MNREEHNDFSVFSRLADRRLTATELDQVQERLMGDSAFRRRYVR